ncbi:hypothetical protein CFIO01_04792 [Colletotrichum fioriniae PJ7]|uniref:Uncharacterized protein n=1 Tax=Colletotrichum fioriniae PJ7 TaxID=1445577 RepID=A0A010RUH1_9PEZI|nr:hypothetical protein CFIO01_04792 [Colletotrichum fioriniae PJ7]
MPATLSLSCTGPSIVQWDTREIEELEVKSTRLNGHSFRVSACYLADLAGRTDFVTASYDQLDLDRPRQGSSFVADNLRYDDLQRCPRAWVTSVDGSFKRKIHLMSDA